MATTGLSLRASARCRIRTRSMQQMVVLPDPAQVSMQYSPPDAQAQVFPPGRRRRKTPLALAMIPRKMGSSISDELARRVQALEVVAKSADLVFEEATISEDELLGIYEDLLALPTPAEPKKVPQIEAGLARDYGVMRDVEKRLMGPQTAEFNSQETPLSTQLRMRRQSSQEVVAAAKASTSVAKLEKKPERRILDRAEEVIQRLEVVRDKLSSTYSTWMQESSGVTVQGSQVPVTVLSNNEWASIMRVCVAKKDGDAGERILELMKRAGIEPQEEVTNMVMDMYAASGNVQKTEAFIEKFLPTPLDSQRDLHVKAHVRATPPNTIPTSALSTLHAYEARNIPAPQKSYSLVMRSLFFVRSNLPHAPPNAIAHSQAWDLFSHMRYVAHSEPDARLYAQMIRACATSLTTRGSEPERALDLWHEMTVDHAIPATVQAYNAVILACSKSGEKHYVNEGFRLAKQMLDGHRDAHGTSEFLPDSYTFKALLEGAKRIKDLGRTRWILAEMVRGIDSGGATDVVVDEEVMMHVFHTYAAYTPPKRPSGLVNQKAGGQLEREEREEVIEAESTGTPKRETPSFTRLPPQGRSEVIAEAKALFDRILEDTGRKPLPKSVDSESSKGPVSTAFSEVKITPRLLSGYLSVFYRHAMLSEARTLFSTLFKEHKVELTPRVLVEAVERCSVKYANKDEGNSLPFAQDVWKIWRKMESGSPPRLVERATFAMVRVLARAGDIDDALDLVRRFHSQYPPSALKEVAPKAEMRATRTVLVGQRPLVRMTSTVEIPDETVPPLFTFVDVEVLHQRLVAARRIKDIGFLKAACMSYEFALRKRRHDTMKAPLEKKSEVVAIEAWRAKGGWKKEIEGGNANATAEPWTAWKKLEDK